MSRIPVEKRGTVYGLLALKFHMIPRLGTCNRIRESLTSMKGAYISPNCEAVNFVPHC